MNCEEAVYSNDYYDFIMEYTLNVRQSPPSPCIQRISDVFDIAYQPREGSLPLNIANYGYTSIPSCFTLMDRSALEASGILRIQNQPTLSLKGQGVLIGFVDTGDGVIVLSNGLQQFFCNCFRSGSAGGSTQLRIALAKSVKKTLNQK